VKENSILICFMLLIFSCSGGGGGGSPTPPNNDGGHSPDNPSIEWLDAVITSDTTWSGDIHVGYVEVSSGVTLTVLPGTTVYFRTDRDYKTRNKGGLSIKGGTLKAVGTAAKQIRFTSSHSNPINGDWYGIGIFDSSNSVIKYAIVEYAELGVEQFDSRAEISHSIIRWNNTEGLYAERSQPIFQFNTLYENAYHEIALEQFNTNVQIDHNIFSKGFVAIHSENSTAKITNNYFENYISHPITLGLSSTLTIDESDYVNNLHLPLVLNTDPTGSSVTETNINTSLDAANKPTVDYSLSEVTKLSYKPATEGLDQYSYVYDTEDNTRKVTDKLGQGSGLKFGWALHYYNGYLWRFSIGEGEHGNGQDLIRIDPSDGSFIKFATDDIMNPRGLTHDGTYFWVNDFSEKKLFRFLPPSNQTEGNAIESVTSYDIPEPKLGGTMGLTYANNHLYLVARDQHSMYKINPSDTAAFTKIQLAKEVGNDIAWDGNHLWSTATDKGHGKFTLGGEYLGKVYQVAYDAWAITWDSDNQRLWTLQKTSELWDDNKLFQIQIKTTVP
jgi:hypothetical protein